LKKYEQNLTQYKGFSETSAKTSDEKGRALETVNKQYSEAQIALDKSFKELAEQKRINATIDERYEARLRDLEMRLRDETRILLQKQNKEYQDREHELGRTITELKGAVQRANERVNWREEEHKKELQAYQIKIQESASQIEHLQLEMAESTRPLLRQIESISQAHAMKQQAWETVEKSIMSRLDEAEKHLAEAEEKEKTTSLNAESLKVKLRTIEGYLSAERSNAAHQAAELEVHRANAFSIEKQLAENIAQKGVHITQLDRTTKDLKLRESQVKDLQDVISKLENKLRDLQEGTKREKDISNRSLPTENQITQTKSETNLVQFMSTGIGMDKIQNMFYQKEAEIVSLKESAQNLEKLKSTLEAEIIKLTSKNAELIEEQNKLQESKTQLAALTARYNTALELLGEKEEQVEEIRADLTDMKSLYRQQVSELLESNEKLKKELVKHVPNVK